MVGVGLWHTFDQGLNVWADGFAEDLFRIALLDDPTKVHDRQPVGNVTHHLKVAGDDRIAQPMLGLQIGHQAEDFALRRDVEPGGGFVGDDELEVQRQRPGNADAPGLPATSPE